jgi:hypothetical protein
MNSKAIGSGFLLVKVLSVPSDGGSRVSTADIPAKLLGPY